VRVIAPSVHAPMPLERGLSKTRPLFRGVMGCGTMLVAWILGGFALTFGVVFGAHADALQTLNVFLKTTQSAQAAFTQTVTSAQREGQLAKRKVSKGSFEFIRPHQFRFDYSSPYAQMILADGQTLWVYDKDIAQVSAKPQAQAMGNTPAALIAFASDISVIQKDFLLENQAPSDGLEWVKGTPKKPDGPLMWVRFGLRTTEQGVSLERLEMRDAFNQESSLSFVDFKINPKTLQAERFNFKPPAGVEVIRQ